MSSAPDTTESTKPPASRGPTLASSKRSPSLATRADGRVEVPYDETLNGDRFGHVVRQTAAYARMPEGKDTTVRLETQNGKLSCYSMSPEEYDKLRTLADSIVPFESVMQDTQEGPLKGLGSQPGSQWGKGGW